MPILHLNGYKIANPTVLGRLSDEELTQLVHRLWLQTLFRGGPRTRARCISSWRLLLDSVIAKFGVFKRRARQKASPQSPGVAHDYSAQPKGWTGPKFVDGKPVEGTWRAHQVPVTDLATKPGHLKILEDWMRSYRPEELFDEEGKFIAELAELAPKGNRRMGANPHANGGLLLKDLLMPDFRDYAVKVTEPGKEIGEATRVFGTFLRDVMKLNLESKNFRVFGPDETASNRLDALYRSDGQGVHGAASADR